MRQQPSEFSFGRPAVPAPLLGPALALMVGMGVAERVGPLRSGNGVAVQLLPALLLTGILFLRRHIRSEGSVGIPPAAIYAGVLVVAAAVGFARHQLALHRPANHIAHLATVQPTLTRLCGTIVSEPVVRLPVKNNLFLAYNPPPRTQFVLALDALRTRDRPIPVVGSVRVSVKAQGLGLRLGHRVELTGRIFRPRGPQNPGETDWASWYRYQGIDAGIVVDDAELVRRLPDEPALTHRVVNAVRSYARGLLVEPTGDVDTDEVSRLLDVMVLGQRSVADRALNEAFLRSGTTHFLAVSGFNVALVAGMAWWSARKILRRGRRTGALAMIAATMLFALIAEPSAPVLRAVVAAIVFALTVLMDRPANALNALSAALIAVLLVNPLEMFRAGFQLSFVLVWGLLTFVPPCYAAIRHGSREHPLPEARTVWGYAGRVLWRWLVAAVATCTVAYLVALPLSLWHFGYLTPWGWPATIAITPGVIVVTGLSVATIIVRSVLPVLSAPLTWLLELFAEAVLAGTRFFAQLPGGLLSIGHPPMLLVGATYAVALLALGPHRLRSSSFRGLTERLRGGPASEAADRHSPPRGRRTALLAPGTAWRICGATVTAMGWLTWLVVPPAAPRRYALHVLSVGDGSAMVLTTPSRHAMVIDVGTPTNSDAGAVVQQALRTLGVRQPDLVTVSHGNLDHYSGLPTLLAAYPRLTWATNADFASGRHERSAGRYLRSKLPAGRKAARPLAAGDRLELDGATVEVLWPPAGLDRSWTANDRSLVLRITIAGRSILLPGDIEKRTIGALLAAQGSGSSTLRADVLVAPHHGIVTPLLTERLLAAVAPQAVIASSRAIRPMLREYVEAALGPTCRVRTTGVHGAVVVETAQDSALTIRTPFFDETLVAVDNTRR